MIERADSSFGAPGVGDQSEASQPSVPATGSAGAQLRAAREAAGLHIGALAVALKVPVAKIEALEADRTDLLPDAVFARALASSICRTLKIDPRPVLAQLPQRAGGLGDQDHGINAPFRTRSSAARAGAGEQMLRPWAFGVALLLLLAAGALYLAPRYVPQLATWWTNGAATSSEPARAPASRPSVAVQPVPLQPVTPGLSPSAAPAPAVAPDPVPATATQPAAASSNEGQLLTFSARGASWVKVTDASRAVVLEKMLQPGESAVATGTPPLAVVVGRADATDVRVRGKSFEIGLHARDNVARFEVR